MYTLGQDIKHCISCSRGLAENPNLQVLRISYCSGVRSGANSELSNQFDQVKIEDDRPPPPPGWCILWMPRNPGWIYHRKKMVEA